MKTVKSLLALILTIGAISLSVPSQAQLLQPRSTGTTTLSDLKKQNSQNVSPEADVECEPQQAESAKKAPSAKKSQSKKATPKSDSNSSLEKAEPMPEEFREEIIASMFSRFRMCKNRSGKLIKSDVTGKPYAIIYYPVKNMEYQACTGYKYSGGDPTAYTPNNGGAAKRVVDAIVAESNGRYAMRVASASEIKTARSHGIVDMSAPSDGIYIAIPQSLFNTLRDIVKQYDSGAVME